MTCEGICRMCHTNRSQCQCIAGRRGGKCVDDYLPAFDVAREYITTEKFFGTAKHETALALIQETRNGLLHGEIPCIGFDLMRVDKDAKRLADLAKGRLFATQMKMAELKDSERHERTSSMDVLERYKERQRLAEHHATA